MTWFIFCLLSIFVASIADLSQQRFFKETHSLDDLTSTVVILTVECFLAFPVIWLLGLQDQLKIAFMSSLLIDLILISLLGTAGTIFYFRSLRVKNISVSIILGMFSVVVSTTLGILMFNESTDIFKFLGIFLILVAVTLSQWQNSMFENNHWFGLLAGIIFGILAVINKDVLFTLNPIVYIFCSCLIGVIITFLLRPIKILQCFATNNNSWIIPSIVAGSAYFLYNFLTFLAYTYGGDVGKMDAINNAQIFLIVIFEFFVLKHTDSITRKFITATIAFVGITILGVV